MFFSKKDQMVSSDNALPGRAEPMVLVKPHYVLKTSLQAPYPDGAEQLIVGLGCFWGAEKAFWSLPGIVTTAVGYSAGFTPNPTYEEVCSGKTGHNEVVLIVYMPEQITTAELLKVFWESHNPTQGMRQGNDSGTQYRSGVYCFTDEQKQIAEATKAQYQLALREASNDPTLEITTEVLPAAKWYFAEEYHQQYLAKNPNGYCGLGGIGVKLPN